MTQQLMVDSCYCKVLFLLLLSTLQQSGSSNNGGGDHDDEAALTECKSMSVSANAFHLVLSAIFSMVFVRSDSTVSRSVQLYSHHLPRVFISFFLYIQSHNVYNFCFLTFIYRILHVWTMYTIDYILI